MFKTLDRMDTWWAGFSDRRGAAPMLVVALFALVLFLPGFFSVPPIDRDEARYAQASKQMAQSGDLIDIRFGDGTRYKKPIGIYWLQSAAASVLGPEDKTAIWVYRVPSLVAAVAATLLTYLIALSLVGARPALLAAMLFATCLVIAGEARQAKTDATLLALILAAQLILARVHMRSRVGWGGAILFWAALGASMLVKGPIGIMVVGLTALVLSVSHRGLSWMAPLRPVLGVPLFLAIVLPWYIAITQTAGTAFWDEALGRDLLGKIGNVQENHGAPPGTYTLAVWLTFWPASLFLPFAIVHAVAERRRPEVLFCLAWILPTWLVFELAATKLMHYVLPTFPALAILAAAGWLGRPDRPVPLVYLLYLAVFLLLAPALVIASLWLGLDGGSGPTWPLILGAAIAALGLLWVWRTTAADLRFLPVFGCGALTFGLAFAVFGHLARVPYYWPAVHLSALQNQADLCAGAARLAVGYQEPSLWFLSHDWPTAMTTDRAAAAVDAAPCAIAHIVDRDTELFESLVARDLEVIGTTEGFNFGRGRPVTVVTYLAR